MDAGSVPSNAAAMCFSNCVLVPVRARAKVSGTSAMLLSSDCALTQMLVPLGALQSLRSGGVVLVFDSRVCNWGVGWGVGVHSDVIRS